MKTKSEQKLNNKEYYQKKKKITEEKILVYNFCLFFSFHLQTLSFFSYLFYGYNRTWTMPTIFYLEYLTVVTT